VAYFHWLLLCGLLDRDCKIIINKSVMSTLDSVVPSVAANKRFSSPISSCNSVSKPRSSSVIAAYNLCRFTDHCDDACDVTGDDDLDPDLVSEDDLDPECDPVLVNGVTRSSMLTPC